MANKHHDVERMGVVAAMARNAHEALLCTERALVAGREIGISKSLERRLVAQAVRAAKTSGECLEIRERELKGRESR